MHRHFFRASDQCGDNDQHIIEHGYENQDRSQEEKHGIHVFHLLVIIMDILQRRDGIEQIDTGLFQPFHILVALLHTADGGGKPFRISARNQFHVGDVTVVAQPVGRTPFRHACQRSQHIIAQMAVFGYIFKYTADGLRSVPVCFTNEGLADHVPYSAHLLGQRARDHHITGTGQDIFRIAHQDRTGEYIEKAGIGKQDGRFIKLFLRRHDQFTGRSYAGIARSDFHLRNLRFQTRSDGPAHLSPGIFLPVLVQAGLDQINAVVVGIKVIIRTFETYFCNQHQTHCQPDGKSQYLNPIVPPFLKQGTDCHTKISHIYIIYSDFKLSTGLDTATIQLR